VRKEGNGVESRDPSFRARALRRKVRHHSRKKGGRGEAGKESRSKHRVEEDATKKEHGGKFTESGTGDLQTRLVSEEIKRVGNQAVLSGRVKGGGIVNQRTRGGVKGFSSEPRTTTSQPDGWDTFGEAEGKAHCQRTT